MGFSWAMLVYREGKALETMITKPKTIGVKFTSHTVY